MTTVTIAVPRREPFRAQAVYYLGWLAMFGVESVAWATSGVIAGLVAFTLGGIGWGWWQAAHTTPDERLRGPVLRLCERLLGFGVVGFVGAVLVGGPPGVAAAATAGRYRDGRRLVIEASLLYALVWAAFHVARPAGGLPIELGPTLPAWL